MLTMKRFKNIITVDDDFPTNLYTQIVLNKEGISENVITKGSAKEVLEHLNDQSKPVPEILLMDLHMPIMSGWDLLNEIDKKNDARWKDMKIFMLTSSAIVDDIEVANDHHLIEGVLLKPLDPKKLLAKL